MSASLSKNRSYYIHSVIFVLIMAIFWILPSAGGITEMGMKVLGVFIGVLYGWIFIGFIWPSLLGMIVLGMTGYASVLEIFQAGMGDSTVVRVFFAFVFAGLLQATGLTNYIAEWCVSRKICRGRPWVLISVLFVASILTGAVNLYAGIVIMWSVFYGICGTVGLKKGDSIVSYVIVGIVILNMMGSMALPFLPNSIIWRSMLQQDILNAYPAPMGALSIAELLLLGSLFIGYFLAGKYILRLKTDELRNLPEEYFEKVKHKKMNADQKFAMWTLIGFVFLLVAPMIMPEGAVRNFFSNIDIVGASALMIILFLLKRTSEGKSVYDFGKMVFHGINWDIIILFAATMPISAAMEAEETGIVSTIVGAIMPVFQSLSPVAFLIVCIIIFAILTQVAHNLILGIVFTPVLAQIGIEMGISPYLFHLVTMWCLQMGFMTPGASAQSALIFANTEWIDVKHSYKYTTLAVTTSLVMEFLMLPVLFIIF